MRHDPRVSPEAGLADALSARTARANPPRVFAMLSRKALALKPPSVGTLTRKNVGDPLPLVLTLLSPKVSRCVPFTPKGLATSERIAGTSTRAVLAAHHPGRGKMAGEMARVRNLP